LACKTQAFHVWPLSLIQYLLVYLLLILLKSFKNIYLQQSIY
jgi:uncharacterized membrane protein (DUF485 family)